MKILQNKAVLATLVLFAAGIIGGFPGLAAKIVLREFPPLTALFIRLTIALILLVPLRWKSLGALMNNARDIVFVGLLLAGNMGFFILGLSKTTVFASSVLYAAVPVIIFLENYFLSRQSVTRVQGVGILLGLGGIILILTQSAGAVNFGSLEGNSIVLLATLCWSFYLLVSKRVSAKISALDLTIGGSIVAWFTIGIAMVFIDGTGPLTQLVRASSSSLYAFLFLGVGSGALMTFLYQWGNKYGSSLVAGSMVYTSTLIGALSGLLFLGETINDVLFIGTACILVGVYCISIHQLVTRRRDR